MRRISLALALVGAVAVGCSGGNKAPAASTGTAKGVTGQYYYVNLFTPPIGGIIASDIGGISCGASAVAVTTATPPQYAYTYYAGASACGTAGQTQFQWAQTVTLTATAQGSNVFLGWAGDCSGTGTCTLTAGADKTVVAIFGTAGGGHTNFLDPAAHGPAFAQSASGDTALNCRTCHGTSLTGGGMAPSCFGCHNVQAAEVTAPFVNTATPSGSHGNVLAWTGHNTGTCARCHTGTGFRDYVGADGTADDHMIAAANQYMSSSTPVTQGTFTAGPLQCNTCHNAVSDPMSGTLSQHRFPSDKVVTTDGATAICIQCHDGGRPGYNVAQVNYVLGLAANNVLADNQLVASNGAVRAHYLPAGSTFFGSDAANWYQYPGKVYTAKNQHGVTADKCTSCHDPHGQKVVNVTATSCGRCHFDETTGLPVTSILQLEDQRQFGFEGDIDGNGLQAGLKAEIDGLGTKLYEAIQAYATNVAGAAICTADNKYYLYSGSGTCGVAPNAVSYNKFTPRLLVATYNYLLYQNDVGGWAHNPRYEIEVLFDSITDLNAGLGTNAVAFTGLRTFAGHFGAADALNPAGGMAFRDWDPGPVPNNCSQCHAGQTGLANYLVDQNTTLTNTPVTGMQCTTCHQPAAGDTGFTTMRAVATLNFPPRKAAAKQVSLDASTLFPKASDRVCATCHSGRENNITIEDKITAQSGGTNELVWNIGFTNPHYLGAAGVMMGNEAHMLYQYAGKTYANKPVFWGAPYGSPHGQSCTSCHAPQFSKHSFEIDLATTVPAGMYHGVKNTATCKACHDAHILNGLETVRTEYEERSAELYTAIQAYSSNAANFGTGVAVPVCYNGAAYPYWFMDSNADGVCDASESVTANGAKFNPKGSKAAFNYKWTQAEPGAWAHNEKYVFQVIFDTLEDLGATPSFTRP